MNYPEETTQYFDAQVHDFRAQYEKKACFKDRLSLFLKAVRNAQPTPARILDFGCGPGVISLELARMGYSVTGIDGSVEMVAQAQRAAASARLDGAEFRQLEATKWRAEPGEFDIVVCSSVIEYIADDVSVLRRFAEAVKPGGALILSVPNAASISGRIEDFRRRVYATLFGRERSPHLNYSLRRYREKQLVALLRSLGFRSIETIGFEFPAFGQLGVALSRAKCIGVMTLFTGHKS